MKTPNEIVVQDYDENQVRKNIHHDDGSKPLRLHTCNVCILSSAALVDIDIGKCANIRNQNDGRIKKHVKKMHGVVGRVVEVQLG